MTAQLDLFDITSNYHGGNPQSVEAHNSIKADKSQLRARVVAHIVFQGEHGATCDEIEQALGLSHQTASARVTEALVKGEVVRSGVKRPTRSGRAAAVHVRRT